MSISSVLAGCLGFGFGMPVVVAHANRSATRLFVYRGPYGSAIATPKACEDRRRIGVVGLGSDPYGHHRRVDTAMLPSAKHLPGQRLSGPGAL